MANAMERMKEELKNPPEDMPYFPKAESRPLVHTSFDDRLVVDLPSGYTYRLIAFDGVSYSSVLNCLQPPCLRELGTDKTYLHVTTFLHELLIQNLHGLNVFFS